MGELAATLFTFNNGETNGISITTQNKKGFLDLLTSVSRLCGEEVQITTAAGGTGNMYISTSKTLAIHVGDRITVNTKVTKSGRAEFSDGTYLDFEHGILVGGNTKEGVF